MPRITTENSPPVVYKNVVARFPDGKLIENAAGFDTDEKWIELYPIVIKNGKRTVKRNEQGEVVLVKNHIDFDVFDKRTGKLLYVVRQG